MQIQQYIRDTYDIISSRIQLRYTKGVFDWSYIITTILIMDDDIQCLFIVSVSARYVAPSFTLHFSNWRCNQTWARLQILVPLSGFIDVLQYRIRECLNAVGA